MEKIKIKIFDHYLWIKIKKYFKMNLKKLDLIIQIKNKTYKNIISVINRKENNHLFHLYLMGRINLIYMIISI